MAVPKMSQLRSGVGVNIVLKAHQQSGILTRGTISDILTSGDHPRGIKVRLSDGKIGRVLSLAMEADSSAVDQGIPLWSGSNRIPSDADDFSGQQSVRAGREGKRKGHPIYDDYEDGSEPQQTRSFADYIKVPTTSKLASTAQGSSRGDTNQLQLEKEFPTLDTALIAAILADHDDAQNARNILSSLS